MMQGPGGSKWHKICFRCTECDKAVDSLSSCVTQDNVLMCKTCYSKKLGPVGYGYRGALASETQGKA
jgi:cysteine/glycine-rich protein